MIKKIIEYKYWLLLLVIVFATQFYYPINGLSDDQMALYFTQIAIKRDVNGLKGFEDVLVKEQNIQPLGLNPCTGYGFYMVDPLFTFVTTTYSNYWYFYSKMAPVVSVAVCGYFIFFVQTK